MRSQVEAFMSQRFLAELWSILLYIGSPTLIGGLALVLLAAAGLLMTRKYRMHDPRDPWKRIMAVLVGMIALTPLIATGALAAMEQSGMAIQRSALLIRGAKAVPGTQIVAVILLAWLSTHVPPKRRAWYTLYGIACILVAFGGSVLLIYVLR